MAITEKNLTTQIPPAHYFFACCIPCTIKKILEKKPAKAAKNKTKVCGRFWSWMFGRKGK
jgi:hypothetical protein